MLTDSLIRSVITSLRNYHRIVVWYTDGFNHVRQFVSLDDRVYKNVFVIQIAL
jgi:hypothetical protein